VELIFGRRVLPSTPGVFATRVVTRGVDVTINIGYKHSRTKEYFKEGRALRIETVVNDPTDLGVLRRLVHLPELQTRARDVNPDCWTMNMSVRAASLRVQPLSGSRDRPWWTGGGPQP
jgi:hypothetical protein